MTQTLQEALLKAGLINQEKLKKSEDEKKALLRAQRHGQRPQPPRPSGSQRPQKEMVPEAKVPPSQSQPPVKPSISKPRPKPEATTRPKEAPAKKPGSVGFIEGKHLHHIRTDCEACRKSSPDVEYYQHKNRSFEKYWLCVRCADAHNISDDFRQTVQSQHAKSGLFRREYGATKIFR